MVRTVLGASTRVFWSWKLDPTLPHVPNNIIAAANAILEEKRAESEKKTRSDRIVELRRELDLLEDGKEA